jgi:hypothetical protein
LCGYCTSRPRPVAGLRWCIKIHHGGGKTFRVFS